MPRNEVETKVKDTQNQRAMWIKRVTKLRASYPWLLYFSVPKMLLLYDKMMAESSFPEKAKQVVYEVCFLVAQGREKLEEKVEASYIPVPKSLLNLHPLCRKFSRIMYLI